MVTYWEITGSGAAGCFQVAGVLPGCCGGLPGVAEWQYLSAHFRMIFLLPFAFTYLLVGADLVESGPR